MKPSSRMSQMLIAGTTKRGKMWGSLELESGLVWCDGVRPITSAGPEPYAEWQSDFYSQIDLSQTVAVIVIVTSSSAYIPAWPQMKCILRDNLWYSGVRGFDSAAAHYGTCFRLLWRLGRYLARSIEMRLPWAQKGAICLGRSLRTLMRGWGWGGE